MKMHKTLFIIGLAVFATPFLGLPGMLETILFAAFGIAIMLIVSTIKKDEIIDTAESAVDEIEEVVEEKVEPTYSEVTETVREELSELKESENEEKSE